MAMLRGIVKAFGCLIVVLILFALVCWVWALCIVPTQKTFNQHGMPPDVLTLDQGWSKDARQQINYTSFGSRLLPYDIYINLELADSRQLLRDPAVSRSLGFIVQDRADNNPDALPVGFAADFDDHDNKWVGLTCAACHMGQVSYRGQKMFIDGGPGLLNFTRFEETVRDALEAVLNDPDKYHRLVERIKAGGGAVEKVKAQVKERYVFMVERLNINKLDVPYGYGRVDAFGQIFNAVSATALHMPDNYNMPNAPVSIPVLWDASHLDLVQWNASAPNKNPGPLGQNVTTALAVYGEIDLKSGGLGYKSSVDITNLGYIQKTWYKLLSPQWPEKILGKIDRQKAAVGQTIYAENCLSCHSLVDRDDPDRKIKASVIPLDVVNTDPQMANNFVDFKSKSGFLQGKKQFVLGGQPFAETVRTFDLVINAALGAMIRHPIKTLSAYLDETSVVYEAPVDFNQRMYKARPLNGLWAAGPFLHNGSVPTVWDLLQAPDARPKVFYVGNREVDPVKIGLLSNEVEHSSLFDTSLQGNSNQGHEFGVHLTDDQKWALLEYLKTL
ncbi:hypothetical protein TDB9533_02293 [Thalassocella blandensis]|nr:hypothetical protein TDB9533_02293 [Thalassocella blandensis]